MVPVSTTKTWQLIIATPLEQKDKKYYYSLSRLAAEFGQNSNLKNWAKNDGFFGEIGMLGGQKVQISKSVWSTLTFKNIA